jgi:2-polyprenyl-3-methyl-5-hydroxy-6-metoxy-1,4-benzoquinol methylase
VCNAPAAFLADHPEAALYRCNACTHVFSDPDTIIHGEVYREEYFRDAHRNWFSHPNLTLFRWIVQTIPNTAKSLVDVGCGNGGFLKYVRTQIPSMHLVGVDIVPNQEIEGISFHQVDALEANLGEKFDVVVSQAVIEHVPDLTKFISQLARLCNDGGQVFVMTLNNDSLLYMTARLLKRFGISIAFNRLYSAHHVHHFTSRSLQTALARGGLRTVNVRHHNAPLDAIDIPTSVPIIRGVLLAGVAMLFVLGLPFRRCYLQTVVAVPITPNPNTPQRKE